MKKALLKWRAKWLNDETNITIIGCTSEPQEGSKKDFKKFFKHSIYFPFPDYTTRRQMWRTFIENTVNAAMIKEINMITDGKPSEEQSQQAQAMKPFFKLPPEFPLSTLAHISDGYSAGSIKKTCESVLTDFRKSRLEVKPLALNEFIGPLSLCGCTDQEANDEFKKFTDIVTGDKKRRDDILKALNPDEDDGGKKGKAAKGKKGK